MRLTEKHMHLGNFVRRFTHCLKLFIF